MARSAATNFTGGTVNFEKATVDNDTFDAADVQKLAEAVDTHDHTSGLGLGVGRIQTGSVPNAAGKVRVNSNTFQWYGSTLLVTAVDDSNTQTALGGPKTWLADHSFAGNITLDNDSYLYGKETDGTSRGMMRVDPEDYLFTGMAVNGWRWWNTSGAAIAAVDNAGRLALGGAGTSTNIGLYVTTTKSISGNADGHGVVSNPIITVTSGTTSVVGGMNAGPNLTVSGGATVTRLASLYANWVAPTVTGTLTNANALYLATPSGAGTNRVIDSASGGYLTTTGIWTDNPSWAALKTDISPVAPAEAAALLDWLRDDYRPVRYRYPGDQPYEHPHFGYLLDDLPPTVREIVCNDPEGGISGKDERGLLLALVQECARRISFLEGAR